jgi:hypothetical protein
MAGARTSDKEVAEILGSNEQLIKKLHPHVFSFFRYYAIGFVLLIWTVVLTWMVYWGPLETIDFSWFGEEINPMVPILLWAAVAALLGGTLVKGFQRTFQVMFWISVIFAVVFTGLIVYYWDNPSFITTWATDFAIIYGYVISGLSILTAEFYRRAFSYYITDLRIVIRYKLFSSKEVNLRFEKIEDWKVQRPLAWRILGVGTIRPYTGTEDGKFDTNRSFDAPDECMYGIKDPEGVKKLLVDLVLERDQIKANVEPRVVSVPKKKKGREPEPVAVSVPEPEPELEPVAVEAPEEPAPPVVYYQPSPEPEPAPPTRNYERIEQPQTQANEGISPPAPREDEPEDEAPRPLRTM